MLTDINCHFDICPGNKWPDNISPYHQYFSCCCINFDQPVNVEFFNPKIQGGEEISIPLDSSFFFNHSSELCSRYFSWELFNVSLVTLQNGFLRVGLLLMPSDFAHAKTRALKIIRYLMLIFQACYIVNISEICHRFSPISSQFAHSLRFLSSRYSLLIHFVFRPRVSFFDKFLLMGISLW